MSPSSVPRIHEKCWAFTLLRGRQIHVCCFHFGLQSPTSAAFTLGSSSPAHVCCFHVGLESPKPTSAAFTLGSSPPNPRLLLSRLAPVPQTHVCCFHFGLQSTVAQNSLVLETTNLPPATDCHVYFSVLWYTSLPGRKPCSHLHHPIPRRMCLPRLAKTTPRLLLTSRKSDM